MTTDHTPALAAEVQAPSTLEPQAQAVLAPNLPVWWSEFINGVSELPDRNSPEDEPEAMVATARELENCALNAIERSLYAPNPGAAVARKDGKPLCAGCRGRGCMGRCVGCPRPNGWSEVELQATPQAQAQAVLAATPGASWRANGEPDPHGNRYDCERAALAMGSLTDDELANGAFMNYDVRPPLQEIIDGKAHSPIAWMTAVKDRIRWLSRSLEKAIAAPPPVAPAPDDLSREALEWLEERCCDLRCVESRIGMSDDADIYWTVVEHHMAKPHERVIGSGRTPLEAVHDARKPQGDPTRWDFVPDADPAAVPARNEPPEPLGARAGSSGSALGRSDARPSGSILGAEPVAAREVSHAAFELCEFIEDIADKPTDSQEVARFKAGQRYAAKSIRKGLGIWLTDEENRRTDAAPLLGTRPEADAATQPLRQPLTEVVPGRMHCARCKFVLSRVNLYVHSGTVGAGDNATEPCPNGCGPLWPMTWEQEARRGYEIGEQLLERAIAAEKRLERLAPAAVEATAPTMLSAAQMIEGWKSDNDCHRSTSAFEWWCAGAIFAQHAHGITTRSPKP